MGPETAPGVPDHASDSQFVEGDLQDFKESFWDDGLTTIETSSVPPNDNSKPILPARDEETPYSFSTVCPLCGTRQDTTSDQIGRKAKCPDCHLVFVVPEPPRSARRARVEESASTDGELRVSQPVSTDLRSKLSDDWIGAAKKDLAEETTRAATGIHPASLIHEALRKAADEYNQLEKQESKLPRHPFRTGLLRFLSSPTTIARWLMTTAALEVELRAVETAVQASRAEGLQPVFGLFVGIFAGVFGVLLFCYISTSVLLVAQHTSQGRDHIEGWPGVNFLDWIFEAWPMFVSLFLALAPGLAVGKLLSTISGDTSWMSWIGVSTGVVALILFFPVLLLSWMENSSPYSGPIWRSLRVSQAAWRRFWMHSGIVVLLIGVVGMLRLKSGSGFLGFFLDAILLFGLLIYFRLLGRLSWVCDEVLTRSENDPPKANDSDEK